MNMDTKVCFKCGRELPLSEFYKHPRMGDGHLNKCKDCTKRDMHLQHYRNMEDPERAEKERARGKDKYRRLYAGKPRVSVSHPENRSTRAFFERRGIDCSGYELHHWNYNLRNDIFFLTPSEHKRVHLKMKFDKDTNMFCYKGNILASRSAHESAIREILSMPIV